VQIRIIDSLKEFSELQNNWNLVYGEDPDAQLFLSWPWLAQWLPKLTSPWFILAAKPAGASDYVAFMPFRVRIRERKQGEFRNELNMAGNFQADYTGFICAPAFDTSAIPAFARYLGKLHWARTHLENIRTTDERLRLFLNGFSGSKFNIKPQERINKPDNINNCICPFTRLPADWDSYLNENLSANTRQKIRRFLRQVESDDSFRITHATADTIERDVNILLQFWSAKWGKRKGNRLLNILNTNHDMLTRCFNAGLLFMPVFWKADVPLGALATYVDREKKSLLFYMAGRDETFNMPPPGLILHAYSIQYAIQNGFRTYDFLRGNEPYKYSLATEERRIACVVIGTKNDRNLGDRLDMRTIPAALDRATDLHKSGRLKEAEQAYRQIIRTDPQCAKALYCLGQLKALTGSHGAAKRLFKSLVAVKPDSEKAWLRLGHSLEARRRFSEAAEAYREVIKQQPTLALAHNKLGNALFKLGRFDDAIAAFDKALSLQPGYLEADVSRANILHMLGRLSREELTRGAELNVMLGDRIRKSGGNAFAVHCYRQALKMKDDLVTAHFGLGQALQAQDEIEKAVQSYRRVVGLAPDHHQALVLLSRLEPPQHAPVSVLQVSP
jgi:tetratricopeptide (TPR) repeat protein